MISRWKVALISSAALLLSSRASLSEEIVGEVVYTGEVIVTAREIRGGSLISRGQAYSESLLCSELARIDSLYFSRGRLAAKVAVDTFHAGGAVDIRFEISEGEQTTIGSISVIGLEENESADAMRLLRVDEGGALDPYLIEESMHELLAFYNNSGFPYAQVWLTGFVYREEANEVDLSFSVFPGGKSSISRIIFEGLSKTDTLIAVRSSRLRTGSYYREEDVRRAVDYLRALSIFDSVQDARVERGKGTAVDVFIPVRERARSNLFQGAFGFSRKDSGDYILNGSVDIELRNIAGTGRDAYFNWLNDGEDYSRVELKFTELFLLSLPVHLNGEIRQEVQGTLYTWHSAGLYLRFPMAPGFSLLAGGAADRNVPELGELLRSVRQRYRVGFAKEAGRTLRLAMHVEGAYKKNYLRGNRTQKEGQFLYRFEGSLGVPAFQGQSIHWRLVSEAVLSSRDILMAESYPLGGALSLRGYRENQFRGERIVYSNFEYWFGEGGGLFLFDDLGAFYKAGEGWTLKNGIGFGLKSVSPLGVVALSFGVGDRLSLEGTRIHIALIESF